MPDVTETPLPGVGVRHEFTTATGERVAVLTHRTGRREIAISPLRDLFAAVFFLLFSFTLRC